MLANREQEGAFSFMPTEVLSQILSDGYLDAADLCRLSLVNKRLIQVVQPVLYNHIVLLSDQPVAVERLCRSLGGNVQLLPLLHHFTLKPTPGGEWVAFPQRINRALERILGLRLPALKSLALDIAKIDINVYNIDPTLPVRSIRMSHATVEQALTLMLLPHIEKIHIGCIDDTDQLYYSLDGFSISSSVLQGRSKFSTARHIRIDKGFGPHTSLSPFIDWPRQLQSLHVSTSIVNGLFPTSIDRHLEPLRDSLIDLSVTAYTNYATIFDGTFIHFEEFKCLMHLKTTASLLFGSAGSVATTERADIFRRLPITLETLTVFFDNLSTAIITGREDAYIGIETPTDYLWIIELTNLPKLRSLCLVEDLLSTDDSPNFKNFQWEPHSTILDVFASYAIDFEARLRSQKQHDIDTSRRRTRIMVQRQARAASRASDY